MPAGELSGCQLRWQQMFASSQRCWLPPISYDAMRANFVGCCLFHRRQAEEPFSRAPRDFMRSFQIHLEMFRQMNQFL